MLCEFHLSTKIFNYKKKGSWALGIKRAIEFVLYFVGNREPLKVFFFFFSDPSLVSLSRTDGKRETGVVGQFRIHCCRLTMGLS
jgi:hypothetical protein